MSADEKEKKRLEKQKKRDKKYRDIVYKGAKRVYDRGLSQMGEGNVSVRVKRKNEMYITPSQNDYATMTPEDVVHIDFNGEHLSKGRRASSEFLLHKVLYESRKKAKCAIHCHAKHAIMLAVAGKKLPLIIEEMAFFIGGEVNVTDYAASGSVELGEKVIEAMGDANAVLIRNHGLFVCGRDMDTTVKVALLVEKMAEVYLGALQLGSIDPLPPEKTKKWIDMFNALNRTAPRKK
ncbi:MAG: class II aldolase/adducin family protein [Candidatus Lokiarchaeota archaeon]|nr:class II aldolase/adducin family protein [Candidatus Lokiarchaeota archaeon]